MHRNTEIVELGFVCRTQSDCVTHRFAPEKVPYAIERYSKETKRLLGVLEARLKETGGPFIMGLDYTVAGATDSH
jgi:glutathione S-transferase